ncbi:hypothetical protein PSA01_34370 [Pseudonocardia saturnea]|uniref:Secreted protein n=1 Tax=Pseudonocardia saturnea TaxID=33909 RepID=A0ABQ0S0H2_9PSEU|nr:hypothetical protein Pdca_66300 [Pseudonocardia autotrophica]GEC26408.1 hypothetical protein PSA01_34370 [Pseudonocardia saturnea]
MSIAALAASAAATRNGERRRRATTTGTTVMRWVLSGATDRVSPGARKILGMCERTVKLVRACAYLTTAIESQLQEQT